MDQDQETGRAVHSYGHGFVWTDEHPQIKDVERMLYTYDKLANDALDRIDVLSPPGNKAAEGCPMSHRDMYKLVEQYSESDETIGKLWRQVTDIPDWVDWEQIQRGQKVVYQYHAQMLLGLMFTSLVGGMASWRIVETLSRTGGFGVNVCRRRLLETLQHFIQVVESLNSVKPHGVGFASSVRVRLLHANVRRRIMRLAAQRRDYYDTESWGVPINDLHQIGTILAYSAFVAFVTLPRMGVHLTEQQTADYLALWRWVGFIMGTPVDWMATPAAAKAMLETVMVCEFKPSENSKIIANNILTAQADSPPLFASRRFLAALAYRLNGEELCGALGIEAPSVWYRGQAAMQGYVLNSLSSNYAVIPAAWQARRDRNFIQFGHNMVTNRKMGGIGGKTTFEFKYLPEIGRMTEMGKLNMSVWQRLVASIFGGLMLLSSMISLYM
ncbi:tat pathway signal sequence [Beauveria brongniartii RCEF 3172]|uniref:Tat pathway signal sequence n=1 Tax=Beauveria brongniartii RCEF 3172 TaxID=1081107 RepID=A0A166YE38_9HYPO|nr:tat pathway signal sequence [Beauveria brongniartii RCEF 3172]